MAEAAVNATGNHVRPLGRHTKDHGQGGFDHRSARSHSSAGWTPKPRPPQGWVLPAPGGKVRSGPLSSARGRPAASSRHLLTLSLLRASRPPPSVRTRVV